MKNILIVMLFFVSGLSLAQTAGNTDVSTKIETEENKAIVDYIRKESVGGKLDFKKFLEEKDTPFIRLGNTLYNKKDFAILLWGKAVNTIGIKKLEEAISIWKEINKRKLSEPELKAIKTGFEIDINELPE